jgi:LIVCS family branched-chain amino acid:cation transporter
VKGFWERPDTHLINSQDVPFTYFFDGIKNGYFTMDLMAALFFAPLVLSQLHLKGGDQTMKKASILAGFILALVYTGFSFLSYFHTESLNGIAKDQILPALSYKILGPYGSIFLMFAVGVACFSTALSLIAAFVNFMHVEIFQKRFSKKRILAFSCALTFAITCFSFEGINQFLGPFLDYFYPILIGLTFYNFFAKQSLKGKVL